MNLMDAPSFKRELDAPKLNRAQPILRMQGISRRFGDVRALHDVDVTVYPGEVLGIVGESGSGKSTLLRMMNLEDNPDQGDYRLAILVRPETFLHWIASRVGCCVPATSASSIRIRTSACLCVTRHPAMSPSAC